MGALRGLASRFFLSTASSIVTFLGTMTAGCDDEGGASSRERCNSWLGNPILERPGGNWSPVFPLLLGVGVGIIVGWLLGFTPLKSTV